MTATKHKILIIDDDAEFAKLTIRLSQFDRLHFEVVTFSSLAGALERLAVEKFDLVFVDITLSGDSGMAVIAQIMEASEDTPVVLMSVTANDELADEAIRQGAQDYLVKSETSPRMLVRIIQHAIDRDQIRRKLSAVTNELRQVNAMLEASSILDPLTEVYNRRGFQLILTREIQMAERNGRPLVAAVMDIDNFKRINDNLGHPCGDTVLKQIAGKIKDSLRISDYVGRIGGDEFLLLLPGTSIEEGARITERLRLSIAGMQLHLSETTKIRITVSIGLAPVSTSIISVDEVISLTDPLLRESKKEGKNQVQVKKAEKNSTFAIGSSGKVPDYVSDLRRSELFFAVKQPIRDLRNESITGFEYLTRMRHDTIGMPNDFFRAAIENNMVTLVDHCCFNVCVNASSDSPAASDRHINLLPSTIMDMPIDRMLEKLATNQKCYCLEISEQQILGSSTHFADSIGALRESGIGIAMDDVGFGNTCLESLLFIEPDIIKIDKKCVIGISRQEWMQKVLRHILRIAEDLNARVIAEGIETREDLATLLELGVEYGQGYYWGTPV